jgi:hypothetical protein
MGGVGKVGNHKLKLLRTPLLLLHKKKSNFMRSPWLSFLIKENELRRKKDVEISKLED